MLRQRHQNIKHCKHLKHHNQQAERTNKCNNKYKNAVRNACVYSLNSEVSFQSRVTVRVKRSSAYFCLPLKSHSHLTLICTFIA